MQMCVPSRFVGKECEKGMLCFIGMWQLILVNLGGTIPAVSCSQYSMIRKNDFLEKPERFLIAIDANF